MPPFNKLYCFTPAVDQIQCTEELLVFVFQNLTLRNAECLFQRVDDLFFACVWHAHKTHPQILLPIRHVLHALTQHSFEILTGGKRSMAQGLTRGLLLSIFLLVF